MCEHILSQMLHECLLGCVGTLQLCRSPLSSTIVFLFARENNRSRSAVCKQVSFWFKTASNTHHECAIDKIWPSILVAESIYFFSLVMALSVLFTAGSWNVDVSFCCTSDGYSLPEMMIWNMKIIYSQNIFKFIL